ncbi:MFS transporter [Lacimicrobium alkaliphilum]|uniref:MFS transporter n=1 Tax=Lacimicrobium alkaliphilum TaxID=1526571 RepID=A0ABQ1R7K6_9ALTE|nr:MFS transporter [Lacimicrobium alkaliphilum]GGD61279.1 MFS transporter [Lacimicrobium alkaliphilum]
MNEKVELTATKDTKMFYGWWIVVGSIIGLAFGYSVIAMSFGTFIKEFETSFGWSRGQISFGSTVIGITAILFFPYVGSLVDKYGAKKILVPSTLLFAVTIASMSLMTSSIWHLYAMCILIPLLGAGTAPLTYSRLLVSWFNKRRGLALGIGLAGVGLGTTLVPLIASYFIGLFSWREAYLAIGLIILVVVLPMTKFLMRDKPADMGLHPDGIEPQAEQKASVAQAPSDKPLIGYTAKEALKQKTFWLMFGSFLITGLTTSTVLVHLVPMMMDRGLTLQQAVETFAYLGISIILGRLVAGYLMDKFFAPYVVVFFMFGPVLGLAAFALGATGHSAALCTALIGIAIGAEFDVMAYFTSRYFGNRAFGVIYGYSYSGFKIGASIGPLIMGVAYDLLGRYTEVLWAMSGTMIICCVLILMMGKYPVLPSRAPETESSTA